MLCKKCGQTIPEQDINTDTMLATCRQCLIVIRIKNTAGGELSKKRFYINKPDGLEVEEQVNSLKISLPWNRSASVIAIPGFIFAAFPVLLIVSMLSLRPGEGPPLFILPCIIIPFMLIPGLLAYIMIYSALSYRYNKTIIEVNNNNIIIKNEPYSGMFRSGKAVIINV